VDLVFQPSPSRSLGFLSDFLSHPPVTQTPPKQRLCPLLLSHHRRYSSLQCSVAQQGLVTANKIGSKTDFFNRLISFRNPSKCFR
jgi:hypothetical protein